MADTTSEPGWFEPPITDQYQYYDAAREIPVGDTFDGVPMNGDDQATPTSYSATSVMLANRILSMTYTELDTFADETESIPHNWQQWAANVILAGN